MRKDFSSFYQVAFSHLLVPRLFDDQYQGIVPIEGEGEDPFFLLPSAASWIRSFFFLQKERHLTILPNSSFESGRMTGIVAAQIGEIDMEWSNSSLRRVLLHCNSSDPITIALPKGFDSFRMRSRLNERGERKEAGEPFPLQKGKKILLDRFQKSKRHS
ncbi:MAG: hypothetical protein HY324_00580 [Chlamydiia bacterium]|nr:hypothetical protein [Chlamydiia bacterium]